MGELAQWQCHKIVRAGKIVAQPAPPQPDPDITTYLVEDVNGVPTKIDVPVDIIARKAPSLGDYIVLYQDGWASWSPAATFEEGYALLTPKD